MSSVRGLSAVVVSLVFVGCLALVGFAAPADAHTPYDGRACSGSSCAALQSRYGPIMVRRGQRATLYLHVQTYGPASAVTLDVGGDRHLHPTGTVTVDEANAPAGSVTRNGNAVRIALTDGADAYHVVAITEKVDNTARTDMVSTANLSFHGPGTATATVRTSQTIQLDRPAVYVWSRPTFVVRAGHHRQVDATFTNSARIETRTATLWITLPRHTRLNAKWGVMFDNRRVHCTGSGRHYRCKITRMHGFGDGLMIDVRAARNAPHHFVGHITLRGEPTGYDNGSNQNTSSTRVRVKR